MDPKHTPGPWHAVKYATRTEIVTRRKAQRKWTSIALVYSTDDDDSEQADANARLIAAGPELLEIAETAIAFIAVWGERYRSDYGLEDAHPRHQALLKKAQDVVAKVTGDA